jgi:phosphoglycolate phosphatase
MSSLSALPPVAAFDLDGTLVDTAPDLAEALNVALAKAALPLAEPAAISPYAGLGGRGMLRRHCELAGLVLDEPAIRQIIDDFLAAYESALPGVSAPYPGAMALVEQLKREGWRVAVCTNKPQHLAEELLGRLAIATEFDAICGANRFEFRKPDPRHLMETIALAGGDPARAVMVGDSETDIATARNAGVPVLGVSFGYSPVPIATLAPDAVIDAYDGATATLLDRLATRA